MAEIIIMKIVMKIMKIIMIANINENEMISM